MITFIAQLLLMMILQLNPLSSQNPSCKRSALDFYVIKYSYSFSLNSFIFYRLSTAISYLLPRGKRTFFALISCDLVSSLILIWCSYRLDVANL
jgi:hypothetical protein